MARLGQTYIVDQASRAINHRLKWTKNNRRKILEAGRWNNKTNNENDREHNGSTEKTFLSQSSHGSWRHLKSLAHNALWIISECSRPSVFIKVACNPLWPEIQERLLLDRLHLTGQTSLAEYLKLDYPLCSITLENINTLDHYIQYHISYVLSSISIVAFLISYIVVLFTNMPPSSNKEALAARIDKHISACVPDLNDERTPAEVKYAGYDTTHMSHKCSRTYVFHLRTLEHRMALYMTHFSCQLLLMDMWQTD